MFSVAAALRSARTIDHVNPKRRFLILIPAYKEDEVILASVESVKRLNYPSTLFNCVVIADGFLPSTIQKLKELGVDVLELPHNDLRNKSRAIRYYLDRNEVNYDACLLLDADNCVLPDMLLKANAYWQTGVRILQAKRVAKNENNELSRLDSLSEIINNHIFRKGQRSLGLSASLIGSGIFIDMNLFREIMMDMDIFSGFDKEMEIRLLRNREKMEYAEDILILDEKVSDKEVFINQRRRWTYAQMYFLKKYAIEAFYQLFRYRNIDFFNKVVQFFLFPRIISLGLSVLLLPITLVLIPEWTILSLTASLLLFIALTLAVKDHLKREESLRLIKALPGTFVRMMYAMLDSSKAAKRFIHTPHKIK